MFVFESITREDLPFLIDIRNECRNSLHDSRVFTLAECKIWFDERRPDFYIIRYAGERIGYFRLSNYNPVNGSIYIGADLHKRFRGQGLARLAYEAFLPRLKISYNISLFKLEVLSHNTVAHALYLRLGFVEIDRKVGFAIRNGVAVDNIVMEMLASNCSRKALF